MRLKVWPHAGKNTGWFGPAAAKGSNVTGQTSSRSETSAMVSVLPLYQNVIMEFEEKPFHLFTTLCSLLLPHRKENRS